MFLAPTVAPQVTRKILKTGERWLQCLAWYACLLHTDDQTELVTWPGLSIRGLGNVIEQMEYLAHIFLS